MDEAELLTAIVVTASAVLEPTPPLAGEEPRTFLWGANQDPTNPEAAVFTCSPKMMTLPPVNSGSHQST